MMNKYYAVKVGRKPGLYLTWNECNEQVKGYSNAKFKAFNDKTDAIEFLLTKQKHLDEVKSPPVPPPPAPPATTITTRLNESPLKLVRTTNNSISYSSPQPILDTTTTQYLLRKNSNTNFTSPPQPLMTTNFKPSPIAIQLINTPSPTTTNNLKRKISLVSPTTTTTTTALNRFANEFDQQKDGTPSKRVNLTATTTTTTPTRQQEPIKVSPRIIRLNNTTTATATAAKSSDANANNKKKFNFSFNGGKVRVYTDGACSFNGQYGASAGIGVFWGANHPLNVSQRLHGTQTNNRAEIHAAIVALEQAIEYDASEVTIITDSNYTIECINKYLPKWSKNNWITSNNQPVKNVDDLKRLNELTKKIKTNWQHVRGHSGNFGNEEADKLARQAIA